MVIIPARVRISICGGLLFKTLVGAGLESRHDFKQLVARFPFCASVSSVSSGGLNTNDRIAACRSEGKVLYVEIHEWRESRQLFRHEKEGREEEEEGCDCLLVKAWWIILCNRIIKRMVRCIIWFHVHCNGAFISWLRERERENSNVRWKRTFFFFFFCSPIGGNGRYWRKYRRATLRLWMEVNRDLGIVIGGKIIVRLKYDKYEVKFLGIWIWIVGNWRKIRFFLDQKKLSLWSMFMVMKIVIGIWD